METIRAYTLLDTINMRMIHTNRKTYPMMRALILITLEHSDH